MAEQSTPTMRSVAKLAGVSVMTVSRVLADPSMVAEDTRLRVLDAIEKLGYVPDRTASSLRSGRTGFIAAVLPTLVNANFADTAHGMTETLREHGYQLVFGYTLYRLDEEERQIRSLLARRPEAIVLTGTVHTREATRALLDSGVPIIEIWDTPAHPIDYAVGFSNHEVGRAAARFLAGLGHRKIAVIGPMNIGDSRDFRGEERLAGFAAALRELNLSDSLIIRPCAPPLSSTEGATAMAMLLEQDPDVEAVFAVSDLIAFGVLMECQRRGIAVPGQISVLGFGDFEISRQSVPSLSTIRIDAHALGRRTAEVIIEALRLTKRAPGTEAAADDPLGPVNRIVDLGFTIQERDSTRRKSTP